MNEQDFRDALRHTMTTEVPPPPMSDSPVLDAAHRDRDRRRTMWAGVGSAVAVTAIAVGVVVLGPSGDEGVRGARPAVQTTDSANQPEPTETPGDTKTPFPNGQTDRTARSGPRFDSGAEVATALAGVIPAGYEAPDDLQGGDAASGTYPLKSSQAQYLDTVNGTEVWEYSARTPVTRDGGVGELSVTVTTPGLPAQQCDNTQPDIQCTPMTVDGRTVHVFESTVGGHSQTAVYRYENGMSVAVSQHIEYSYSGHPALVGLPLTAEHLAALALDSHFNID